MFVQAIDPDEALVVSIAAPPRGHDHYEAVERFYEELTHFDPVPGKLWIWVRDRLGVSSAPTTLASLRSAARLGAYVGHHGSRIPPMFTIQVQPCRRDRISSHLLGSIGRLFFDVGINRTAVVDSWPDAIREAEILRAAPLPRLEIMRGQLITQLAASR